MDMHKTNVSLPIFELLEKICKWYDYAITWGYPTTARVAYQPEKIFQEKISLEPILWTRITMTFMNRIF